MLSYETVKEAETDRDMQRSLLVALDDASKRSLRRDECGAGASRGARGTSTHGAERGLAAPLQCWHSPQMDEHQAAFGVLQGHAGWRRRGLPSPPGITDTEQAVAIRKALGIKRKRKVDAVILQERLLRPQEGGFQRRQRARRARAVSMAIPKRSGKKLARTPPLARLRNDAS